METVTVYNRNHGGDPGSADYEHTVMWCNARDFELPDRQVHCGDWELKSNLVEVTR